MSRARSLPTRLAFALATASACVGLASAAACGHDREPSAQVRDAGPTHPSKEEEAIAALHLPEDPGEAGKRTVKGIDSNDNGVRDDVERFIGIKHWRHRERVIALFDLSKRKQNMLLAGTAPDVIRREAASASLGVACLARSFDGNIGEAQLAVRELQRAFYNTRPRLEAYLRDEHYLEGFYELPADEEVDAYCAEMEGR